MHGSSTGESMAKKINDGLKFLSIVPHGETSAAHVAAGERVYIQTTTRVCEVAINDTNVSL
jgi:hypothetical protein